MARKRLSRFFKGIQLASSGTDAGGSSTIKRIHLNEDSDVNLNTTGAFYNWTISTYKDSDVFTHSVSSNAQRITVLEDGLYMVHVSLTSNNNTDSARTNFWINIYKNGSVLDETRSHSYDRGASYGDKATSQINHMVSLSANDYIEIFWDVQVEEGDSFLDATYSKFQMYKLGEPAS